MLEARKAELDRSELDTRLAADVVDVTLPGTPAQPVGRLHLLTQTRRELEDIFIGLGFAIAEGPEVETVYYNFDALNHTRDAPDAAVGRHVLRRPRRAVLRTHTSPMQTRAMEQQPPPLYIVVPGRTYRRDNDATHTPQFHQVEGLAVDEDITLADLKGTLSAFARAVFGDDREIRMRPHFFPFTEPSVESTSPASTATAGLPARRLALPAVQGRGRGSSCSAPARSTPTCSSTCASTAMTPSATRASPSAWGSSGSRCSSTACPTCGCFYDNDLRFLEQFG